MVLKVFYSVLAWQVKKDFLEDGLLRSKRQTRHYFLKKDWKANPCLFVVIVARELRAVFEDSSEGKMMLEWF